MFDGAQPSIMEKNKIIKFLQSFIAVPLMLTAMPFSPITQAGVPIVNVSQIQLHTSEEGAPLDVKSPEHIKQAKKIDAYFASMNLPLTGYGDKLVTEAEKNDIPYNLVASIGFHESTAGKFACGKNYFGWDSCHTKFDSVDQAIEVISKNLGGNEPRTAHWYDGKDIDGILKSYNHVNPRYNANIKATMRAIDNQKITDDITSV